MILSAIGRKFLAPIIDISGMGIFGTTNTVADDNFKIEDAKWNHEKNRLVGKGKADQGKRVTLIYASDHSVIASKVINETKLNSDVSNRFSPNYVPGDTRANLLLTENATRTS